MSLSPGQARVWQALALGPQWLRRGAAVSGAGAGLSPPPAEADIASMDWEGLQHSVQACRRCGLCQTRKQTVFGVGAADAHWMVVGEAPGAEEDDRGEPFVGQAGRLLDNMLGAAGLSRTGGGEAGAFIANVLKCRPPGNRNPEPEEVARCEPYLKRQIELLQPRVIVVMGRFAAQSLLATDSTIGSLRGRPHEFEAGGRRIPVIVTYHPAYLLRTLSEKSKSWADLCLAREAYEDAVGAGQPAASAQRPVTP